MAGARSRLGAFDVSRCSATVPLVRAPSLANARHPEDLSPRWTPHADALDVAGAGGSGPFVAYLVAISQVAQSGENPLDVIRLSRIQQSILCHRMRQLAGCQ